MTYQIAQGFSEWTVVEWGMFLGFLTTFVTTLVQTLRASKGTKKVQAVVDALEEASEAHPEAMRLVKAAAKHKATSMGVEVGMFGLSKDVARHTSRLEKRPIAPEPEKPE